jgi:hypothetical protein
VAVGACADAGAAATTSATARINLKALILARIVNLARSFPNLV